MTYNHNISWYPGAHVSYWYGTFVVVVVVVVVDDEDDMVCLDTLIETLHGEELTRILADEGDADFLARRTLVRWLYTSQDGLTLR